MRILARLLVAFCAFAALFLWLPAVSPYWGQASAATGSSRLPRLVIPKIGVNARVVEGVTLADLRKGPGHFPGTAGPGQIGNYAIAGHRNINGSRFMFLPRLSIGDQILVYVGQKVYRYRVFEMRTVLPEEMWVTEPIPGKPATIMLLTCIPVPNPTHRFIVFGELER